MNVTLGSAPDSWGVWFPDDPRQTPWHRFLDEIAEAGYRWTELGPYGYLPTNPQALRRELERRGLGLTAGVVVGPLHDPAGYPSLRQQFLQTGELVAALGGQFLVLIGDMYRDLMTGQELGPAKLEPEAWLRLVETTNELGRLAHDRLSLRLVFHSHADTHVEYPEQLEALVAQTDPDGVGICLDLGHLDYRGGDSVEFMRKHHARVPYLHLKSVDPAIRDEVLTANVPFATAVAMGVFCEPDRGAVDFPAFARLLREIDYEGLGIVEQDMYPVDFDKPLPIAKRTRAYLESLGLG